MSTNLFIGFLVCKQNNQFENNKGVPENNKGLPTGWVSPKITRGVRGVPVLPSQPFCYISRSNRIRIQVIQKMCGINQTQFILNQHIFFFQDI